MHSSSRPAMLISSMLGRACERHPGRVVMLPWRIGIATALAYASVLARLRPGVRRRAGPPPPRSWLALRRSSPASAALEGRLWSAFGPPPLRPPPPSIRFSSVSAAASGALLPR
ncbi:hypothetical protein GCM10009850_084510 [Nonomuraea monospora]|uniref:Uncharacterized protein n=1 Tax=Nonomuraea monospora TaxID=568818 RepID=A0ABN3CUA1_9ACTN